MKQTATKNILKSNNQLQKEKIICQPKALCWTKFLPVKNTSVLVNPKDVSHIVSKYLPIGSSKKEVIDKLNEMNQHYSDKGHIIYAGYGKQIHPMIPNPEVMIELKFNASGYLENIDSQFYYAQ